MKPSKCITFWETWGKIITPNLMEPFDRTIINISIIKVVKYVVYVLSYMRKGSRKTTVLDVRKIIIGPPI